MRRCRLLPKNLVTTSSVTLFPRLAVSQCGIFSQTRRALKPDDYYSRSELEKIKDVEQRLKKKNTAEKLKVIQQVLSQEGKKLEKKAPITKDYLAFINEELKIRELLEKEQEKERGKSQIEGITENLRRVSQTILNEKKGTGKLSLCSRFHLSLIFTESKLERRLRALKGIDNTAEIRSIVNAHMANLRDQRYR